MRFHVVALPHTNVVRDEYPACAFTGKVRRFCMMMKSLGHSVFLYAGTKTDAPCDELITCISEEARAKAVGTGHYVNAPWGTDQPHWQALNTAAIAGIKAREQPGDFVCVIGGFAHKPVADAFPNLKVVEFGIGYGGSFARYRVWESYTWQHLNYGAQSHSADINGRATDVVIPNYFEVSDFPFAEKKGNYYLFVGRLIDRKGYQIAADVCREIGAPLIVAGPGTPPPGTIYAGVVGPEARGQLMSLAKAVFVPTQYIEPFGGVAVEAMMCGTPVISTDWGAMTETVVPGTGFRCSTHAEFVRAARNVHTLDPHSIRAHAVSNYSMEVIGPKYQAYFERLLAL